MAPRPVLHARLDADLLDGLRRVEERDGILVSEQVRRAVRAWLNEKGVVEEKTDRKRVGARKRS
jgi:hypothetical protein